MITAYTTDSSSEDLGLVLTAPVQQTLDCLRVWLEEGNEQHFLLVGEHGTAKTLIVDYLIKERSDTDLARIFCSSDASPEYVISKINHYCMIINTSKGRVYKPRKRFLVLHLQNMHLLEADRWGTNMLIAFLQQVFLFNERVYQWFKHRIGNRVTVCLNVVPGNLLLQIVDPYFTLKNVRF